MFVIYEDIPIQLSNEQVCECGDFVDKSNSRRLYLNKRNANVGRVYQQELEGKLGEYAVSVFMNTICKVEPLLKPDFKIYKGRQKSWSADLPYKDREYEHLQNIHVKTCNSVSAKNYGESWVFQMEDKIFSDERYSNDWCAFVLYNVDEDYFLVRGIVSLSLLKQYDLFKEMKLEIHKGNKCAVYYNDLVESYTKYIKSCFEPIKTFFKKDIMDEIFTPVKL